MFAATRHSSPLLYGWTFLDVLLTVGFRALLAHAVALALLDETEKFPLWQLALLGVIYLGGVAVNYRIQVIGRAGEEGLLRATRKRLVERYAHPLFRPLDTTAFAVRTSATSAQLAAAARTVHPLEVRICVQCTVLLIIIGLVNVPSLVIVLLTLPFLPVFLVLIGKGSAERWEDHVRENGELSTYFADQMRGLTTSLSFRRDGAAAAALAQHAETFEAGLASVMRLSFLTRAVVSFFASVSIAAVAIFLGLNLLEYINFGAFPFAIDFRLALFILLLLPEFYGPLLSYVDQYHEKRTADAAGNVLGPDLEWKPPNLPAPAPAPPAGTLVTDALTFRYAAGPDVLQAVNLRVAPGEWIAITGPSGCGKTTLLKLLAGLLPPSTGTVSTGGELAYLPQDERLLSASLAENLLLPDDQLTDQARTLATRLNVSPATIIGPSGHRLSGGQARRVMIARALARPTDILLLDEVFAHVDEQTAEALLTDLHRERAGRTIVQVSHDPRWLRFADRRVDLTQTATP